MNCLAICKSGNYALKLCNLLEKAGYYCEVTSTPCRLAREGCSYCIKFSYDIFDNVRMIADQYGITIVAAYRIEKNVTSNKYIAIN
jgi:hypothetical protein